MERIAYVGMDVDKEKIAVAVVGGHESEPRIRRVIANRESAIESLFRDLLSRWEQVVACYEAGFCGFTLYRRIMEMGVACMVVAPASVPKKAGDRIKTDRRDAVKLAYGLRNGELSPVHVPSRSDEATRDYLRLLEDTKQDLKAAKQRLLHFLHRHDCRYEGGRTWTVAYRRWLRSLQFSESPAAQATFEEYLSEVSRLEEKRSRLTAQVEVFATDERYAEAVSRLRAFRGVGSLIALSLVVEIGDFRRFSTAAGFMAFLGLVPQEHSSGERRRQGGITKTGNTHLRTLLVEAAWHARTSGRPSQRAQQDRLNLPVQMVAYADRAAFRLHRTFWRLVRSGKPSQVATVAVARQLAGFIWGAMVGNTA